MELNIYPAVTFCNGRGLEKLIINCTHKAENISSDTNIQKQKSYNFKKLAKIVSITE